MTKLAQLKLSKDGRGFFKTIGYHQNDRAERVPRKFRLGYERHQALRKLEALLDAWDDLPGERGTKVWNDAAIEAAMDSVAVTPEPFEDGASTTTPTATPVVPPRTPKAATPPPTSCVSFGFALDEFATFTEARNDVGSIHRDGTRSRINSIKIHLGVTPVSDTDRRTLDALPVCDIGSEVLGRIRNLITSRPLTHHQRKNRKPISIDTVKNWLMVLGMAFDWFEITPRIGWTPPHHRWREQFTLSKKQEYALQTPEERDNGGKPKPAFTVDELVMVYKNSTKLGRRYLLMGLTLGWAQEAITSFRRPHFVQKNGEYFIDRRRGKTGVEGYWWVCPDLVPLITEAMGWTPANEDDLAFLTEDGLPLVHGKTDTIRLTGAVPPFRSQGGPPPALRPSQEMWRTNYRELGLP